MKARVGRSAAREPAASYGGPVGEVVLYQAPDGSVELRIRLERESLWLSQRQMSLLFDKDTDTIGLHLRNIYRDGELDEAATTEEFSVVQAESTRQVRRRVRLFNLDAVISVGYRVNSKRGTQFRIWATRVLREHVLCGYTVNESRLSELKQAVRLVADLSERATLGSDEASALTRVVADYNFALDLLDDYDHQRLNPPESRGGEVLALEVDEALRIVERLRERFGGSALFGREKDLPPLLGRLAACRPRRCLMSSRSPTRRGPCDSRNPLHWSRLGHSPLLDGCLMAVLRSGIWGFRR